jgi:transcriptional regulator with XRE-family HTH domain
MSEFQDHPPVYGIDLYLHKLRMWANKNGFSAHGLAQACDLSPGTLQKMFKNDWNPTVNTLATLESFMYNYDRFQQHEENRKKSQSSS